MTDMKNPAYKYVVKESCRIGYERNSPVFKQGEEFLPSTFEDGKWWFSNGNLLYSDGFLEQRDFLFEKVGVPEEKPAEPIPNPSPYDSLAAFEAYVWDRGYSADVKLEVKAAWDESHVQTKAACEKDIRYILGDFASTILQRLFRKR